MGKKAMVGWVVTIGAIVSSGCSSMNNTERGALGGGTIGALAGAAIDRREPGRGALIGAAAGGVLGGVAGNAEDAREEKIKQAQSYAAQPVQGTLRLEDISDMAKHGIGDDVIRNRIRQSGTRYNLGTAEITWLHDNGVSDGVISEMQNTMRYRYGRRVVYGDDPVVVVPPPPPAVVVQPSVGFGYGYYRIR